jgi:hypothetical protein
MIRSSMNIINTFSVAPGLGLLLFAVTGWSQVQSITLGIRTHCPYGIRGCWPEIRDGLERPEAIASICKTPDDRTDTCELRMRPGWAPDPDLFAANFREMHIGVDVRGVEAVVDGTLAMDGTNVVLRVGNSGGVLFLAPLARKVQWDTKRKQPERITRAERKAFEKLAAHSVGKPGRFRVTGPLNATGSGENARRTLEVRTFEVFKEPS